DLVTLELNSLGDSDDRARYREALVAYLSGHIDALDEDSRRRLERNPLRILDSKDPATREVLKNAPRFDDFLGEESRVHFAGLRAVLDAAGVPYRLNPALVRGLDYYGKTVFEWVTDALGAQGTVCAGGRYDGLVSQLGGKPTPAVGFAMGMERLILLLAQRLPELPAAADLYLLTTVAETEALVLAEELRDLLPGLRIQTHCGGGSLKSQMKKADKSGARWALIVGEEELAAGQVTLKPLRGDGEQQRITRPMLADTLASLTV
ncbi:MAG: histidine--tRNA ligase, partial [Gammaproteobacteria bacterium HGW-Gammaproteobacteria-14]